MIQTTLLLDSKLAQEKRNRENNIFELLQYHHASHNEMFMTCFHIWYVSGLFIFHISSLLMYYSELLILSICFFLLFIAQSHFFLFLFFSFLDLFQHRTPPNIFDQYLWDNSNTDSAHHVPESSKWSTLPN